MIVARLLEELPRQQFAIAVQAAISGRILGRSFLVLYEKSSLAIKIDNEPKYPAN